MLVVRRDALRGYYLLTPRHLWTSIATAWLLGFALGLAAMAVTRG